MAKEGLPSKFLILEFQPVGSLLGDGTTTEWMRSLEVFKEGHDVMEIGTIFDRLPLDRVYTLANVR